VMGDRDETKRKIFKASSWTGCGHDSSRLHHCLWMR
jgi:hypothetical protein